MPLVEPAAPRAAGGAAVYQPPVRGAVVGWGGGPEVPVALLRPGTVDELAAAVSALSARRRVSGRPGAAGAIARGQGRSYGDAAQRQGGLVLDMTGLRNFELDASAGSVTVEAGVTLGRLLTALAPDGWTLPVVPGTQHVTVGGAIASDIHGKNHGSAGTFGRHVSAFGLLTAAGDLATVSRESHPDLFAATLGGMGLTGAIAWATIALTPLRTAWLSVDVDRVQGLDDALALLLTPGGSHRVAWLDLLGPGLARGIVTRAEPLPEPPPGRPPAALTVAARLTVPPRFPGRLLRPGLVRAHNEYRFRRSGKREVGRLEAFGSHMFPLDVLRAWPRLYGRLGFVQYQLVVPRGQEPALEAVIVRLRRSPVPCFLAVLKDFGPSNGSPLSFPIAGWTLALDLPRAAPGLEVLLRGFDELVAQAGGRVYLAKDALLAPDALAAMYPRLDEWRAIRDRVDPDRIWCSDLAVRTGLIGAAG